MNLTRLAILGSGTGSNFDSIIDSIYKNELKAQVNLVISNKKDAPILTKAKKNNLPAVYIPYLKDEIISENFHYKALKLLEFYKIDLIILAGFMRIILSPILSKYKDKILNIHPSLLPKYKGLRAWEQAINANDKETGATVHLVNEKIDSGKILSQKKIKILPNDSPETLHQRIKETEHFLLPNTINSYIEKLQSNHLITV